MYRDNLRNRICELSADKTSWDSAKKEWNLIDVYLSDEPDECLCGKYPIIEICVMRNSHNGNIAIVGNCCVKKFFGDDRPQKIIQAVRKLSKDGGMEKSMGETALEYLYEHRQISQKSYVFYLDTIRKRNLSDKQMKWRLDVNQKLLAYCKRES